MDKNAIKKFAVWARRELIARVSQRAALYEITEQGFGDPYAESVHGQILTSAEKKERKALIEQIKAKGYREVMEEVAYTWFNRFCALRFMEVNGYLPSHVRVFTDDDNAFKPQILAEAINLELDGLDMEKVYALKNDNETEALFKYLLIVQCNALNPVLPGMFQKIEDYTELLFPDHLLRAGSVIEQMVAMIPEDDWQDQVQIIGWLYQYYNSEKKDDVFAALKKNVKITKENIPAATQLFTPDWIVRYMVENSLGRLWVEGHPNEELQSQWKYYLEEAEQELEVQTKLAEIRKEYAVLNPEDIKCIDPCCGSGHILAYMFDVLVQIYEAQGYSTRDAVKSIVENNLYGLDIDERAAQLAYFSVMMKGRQYDSRFFKRGVQPHVFAIKESHTEHAIEWGYLGEQEAIGRKLYDTFVDVKEYGSILTPDLSLEELDALDAKLTEADKMADYGSLTTQAAVYDLIAVLDPLLEQARMLVQKYHAVVTNPPYMGGSGMSGKLSQYVKKNYPDSKSDLFAVFMEKWNSMVCHNGFNCMVTMQSWMFLSSFEKMRTKILISKNITNLMHMENMVLGIAFGTAVTIMQNNHIDGYKGTYNQIKLCDIENNEPREFPVKGNRFAQISTDNFSKIPGSPVAYWVGKNMLQLLIDDHTIGKKYSAGSGLSTSDNERFLRLIWEVDRNDIATGKFDDKKWFLFQKGGEYRKWYGNLEYVVNWENDGEQIKYWVTHNPKDPKTTSWSRRIFNTDLYFLKGITWGVITSGTVSFRVTDEQSMISNAAGGIFHFRSEEELYSTIGALNTKIWSNILNIINPTINCSSGILQKTPIPKQLGSNIAKECIVLSRCDWDSFETSWDFKRHPLVNIERSNKQKCKSLKDALDRIDGSTNSYVNNPSLDVAKECIQQFFMNHSKKCVFNIEFVDKESIFARSEHMVSCYLIGKYIYENIGVFHEAFNHSHWMEIINIDFDYLWFLCCLSHDLLSEHESEYEKYVYKDLNDFIEKNKICHTIYSPNLPEDIQFSSLFFHTYSENTVKEYFIHRAESGTVDHGIAEGYLLFDLLVKNYLSVSKENRDLRDFETYEHGYALMWKKEQIVAFELVADAVISHNIWHKHADELQPQIIPEITTDNAKEIKLSMFGNPLAYLFGIVDSLEPLKFFRDKCSSEIFETIRMGFEDNTIVLNSEFSNDDWYCRKIKDLSTWISSIQTSFENNEIRIKFDNFILKDVYKQWEQAALTRFNQLKANEEELNRIFIDIYGLQDELTPEVEEKDVTVRKADLQREIKSLISYAVGCMFGRYSLDVEGLAYAGGEWDNSKYCTIIPDKDSILPICDDEYFEDDIAAKFIDFVRIVYGEETLEENLKFIAEALGGKGQPREVIRNYFLNDFFKDHCKIYQKRPIYWLFDSGKKNGFKCLIYMHRYQPDTIARIRTDYVHEQQSRYRTAIADLENRIANAGTSERVKLSKQLKKLTDQAEETRVYEEKIHHLADRMIKIDLDDGVKVNYAKFADVLAKVK